jgi:hypothetical protein
MCPVAPLDGGSSRVFRKGFNMPTLQERATAIREYVRTNIGGSSAALDGVEAYALGELSGAFDAGVASVIPPTPGPAPYAMVIAHPYGNLACPSEEVSPDFEVTIVASPFNSTGRAQLFNHDNEPVSPERIFTCVDGTARVTFTTLDGQPIPPGSYKLQVTFSDFQYGHYITLLVAGGGDPVPDEEPVPPGP